MMRPLDDGTEWQAHEAMLRRLGVTPRGHDYGQPQVRDIWRTSGTSNDLLSRLAVIHSSASS